MNANAIDYVEQIERKIKSCDKSVDIFTCEVPKDLYNDVFTSLRKKGYNPHYYGESFGMVKIHILLKEYEITPIKSSMDIPGVKL